MVYIRGPLKRGFIPEMDLPDGKTCGDCVHVKKCCNLFGHLIDDESCDWSPSRFKELEIKNNGS